jgi:hypothetical protein
MQGMDSILIKLQDDHNARYGVRAAEGKPSGKPEVCTYVFLLMPYSYKELHLA